jgi:diguanylate cyclase (GGDEF)-like protein
VGRSDELLAIFMEFAERAAAGFHVEDILRDLASAAARVLEGAGAGVSFSDGGRLRHIYGTPSRVERVEQMQDALHQGPCHDAYSTREVVVEPDLAANADRWPEFVEHALRHGLHAAVSVPLIARDEVWGALDLYRDTPGAFSEDQLALARVLANVAVGYVVMAADRDTAVAAQAASAHAATHDALTGLPNRALLHDRLSHAIALARRHQTPLAVVFLDLDGFKAVNDDLGHHIGDQLLVELAARLSRALRAGDTLARLGGDEFVVICEGLAGETGRTVAPAALAAVLARVDAVLAQPFVLGGHTIDLRASVGTATAADDTADGDALLRAADADMYAAKRNRRRIGEAAPSPV